MTPMRQAHWLGRGGLAFMFAYHGLVPKLIALSPWGATVAAGPWPGGRALAISWRRRSGTGISRATAIRTPEQWAIGDRRYRLSRVACGYRTGAARTPS